LLAEIDSWKGGEDGEEDDKSKATVADWEKTSLKPYVEQFRSFVSALIKDEGIAKVKREREDDSMDF
jgi:DNA primase small subunit